MILLFIQNPALSLSSGFSFNVSLTNFVFTLCFFNSLFLWLFVWSCTFSCTLTISLLDLALHRALCNYFEIKALFGFLTLRL